MGMALGSCCCRVQQRTAMASAAPTQVHASQMAGAGAAQVPTMPWSANGVGGPVRNANSAAHWLEYIKRETTARFGNFAAAQAAGYKRNPASGEDSIQHYIHDGVFKVSDATRQLEMPATLMYRHEQDGSKTLVGVMLSAKPGTQLPDFGAGSWHRHGADDRLNMHVYFDKGVQQGAFEDDTGTV